MRRTLVMSGVAIAAGVMVGCGGGGGTRLNSASKIVVGYVWVSQTNTPSGTPDVVVTNASVAPAGYVAPTGGTFTLTVANGEITRASDTENFAMSAGNAVVARVTSRSEGTPAVTFSTTGLTYTNPETGVTQVRSNIPSTSVNLTGTNDTIQFITFAAPTYTAGPPAAMKVLVRDPSTLYGAVDQNRFGALTDTLPNLVPSSALGDRYEVVVVLTDANGIVIPGTTFNVTDPNGNTAEQSTSFSGGLLTVAGGGVEGDDVSLTFTSPQAPGLQTVYLVNYTYGTPANFRAVFSPASDATIQWPTVGVAATTSLALNVNNGRGISVPNANFSVRRLNTAATAQTPYPAPATGSPLAVTSVTTDASGNANLVFSTPDAAAGNSAFNELNIKYGTGNAVQVLSGASVLGSRNVIVTRALNSLVITGPSRMDTSTVSAASTAGGANPFRVTDSTDVDTQSLGVPTAGTINWTLTNTPSDPDGAGPNPPVLVGNLDDQTVRSVSLSSFNGGGTGTLIRVNAGNNAGQFTLAATDGTVTSNTLTTNVLGVPAKILLSPAPSATGYTGSAGTTITTTVSFIDGFGNAISTVELSGLTKAGFITSVGGGNIQNPAPASTNFTHLITPTSSGTTTAQLLWGGTWTGTAGGSATPWNISRDIDINVP